MLSISTHGISCFGLSHQLERVLTPFYEDTGVLLRCAMELNVLQRTLYPHFWHLLDLGSWFYIRDWLYIFVNVFNKSCFFYCCFTPMTHPEVRRLFFLFSVSALAHLFSKKSLPKNPKDFKGIYKSGILGASCLVSEPCLQKCGSSLCKHQPSHCKYS